MAQYELGSPEWWLRRLHGRIVARRTDVQNLHNYYDGVHRLAFASQKFLDAFGGLFRAFADNWCALIVDAAEERLNVEGFRIDPEQAKPDADAWRIWQENELDAQSQMAHVESLICGESYVTTWIGDSADKAEITVSSPSTSIVETHPTRSNERLAGLRLYLDEGNYEHAELFLPDGVYVYRSKTRRPEYDSVDPLRVHWVIDEWLGLDLDVNGSMDNPLGEVPMVPLPNRPRLGYGARTQLAAQSEISAVIPLQDAVNKVVADMMVAAEYAAYPQRYMLGLDELPRNEAGQEINPFTPDKRVWLGEGDATAMQIGEFTAADLGNYVAAIDMLIQHVASITRTPPHYLNSSADRLSGESIKSAETGLVAKVQRKQRHFGAAWEEVMRIAGAIEGNQLLANAESAETVWGDPESRTESQHVDAVQKKQAMGVPWDQSMEDLGYTPTQVQRMRAQRKQDVADGFIPPPTPGGSPVAPQHPAAAAPQ